MAERKDLIPIRAVAFLLNGVVPFSVFIAAGLVYSIGSSLEIVTLVAALVAGGFGFSALGIAFSRSGGFAGIPLLVVPITAALTTYLVITFSPVLSIEMFALLVLINMSSNSPVSYAVSRLARGIRGKGLSISSTFFIGAGAPAIFLLLFFIYAYLGYSNLPLIALCSEIVVFVVSYMLISHSLRSHDIKPEVVR